MTWRRSARSSGERLGPDRSLRQRRAPCRSPHTQSSDGIEQLHRCPTAATPSSFRVSCVRLGRTVSSISFSRNAASYFPRPRLRSQTTMSMTAPTISGCAHHGLAGRACPGGRLSDQPKGTAIPHVGVFGGEGAAPARILQTCALRPGSKRVASYLLTVARHDPYCRKSIHPLLRRRNPCVTRVAAAVPGLEVRFSAAKISARPSTYFSKAVAVHFPSSSAAIADGHQIPPDFPM